MRKKTIAALVTAVMAVSALTGCSSSEGARETGNTSSEAGSSAAESSRSGEAQNSEAAEGEYTIGVAQYAVHGSLDNCREGFLKGWLRKDLWRVKIWK